MAMVQAGAGGKVLLLLGAGVTGSYILNHTQLSDLLSDLSKVLSKHLKDNRDDSGGGEHDGATAALTAQVRKLTQELRQLASSQGRPIIVNSDNRGSGGGFMSMLLPIAAVGAVGYGYMWWKGWKFGDLMYVTKKGMANAVESVRTQMEGLAGALAATKRQISSRLDGVTKSVNDNMALTGIVREELSEAKSNLGYVGQNVGLLQDDMSQVKDHLTTLESKQDFANQGIVLLCRFVVDGMQGNLQGNHKPELVQGLHAYSRGAMTRCISSPSSNAGLKLVQELEGLVEKIEIQSSSPLLPLTGNNGDSAPRPSILTRATSCRR